MPKGIFTKYTSLQEENIKNNFLTTSVKKLAQETNSSFGRIMRFLDKNNLKIPIEIIEQRKEFSKKKKGCVPFNIGKKQSEYMSHEAIERTKNTRFKKGNEPHNTKKEGNGTIVSRKDKTGRYYKYIRVSIGVWELYHRVVWEQKYGKIPENHVIIFKDENNKNVDIENLELISMTENMLRNSIHNYPQEIIPSLVLSKKIETKIKNLQNG
jgi:hypothetical protein